MRQGKDHPKCQECTHLTAVVVVDRPPWAGTPMPTNLCAPCALEAVIAWRNVSHVRVPRLRLGPVASRAS